MSRPWQGPSPLKRKRAEVETQAPRPGTGVCSSTPCVAQKRHAILTEALRDRHNGCLESCEPGLGEQVWCRGTSISSQSRMASKRTGPCHEGLEPMMTANASSNGDEASAFAETQRLCPVGRRNGARMKTGSPRSSTPFCIAFLRIDRRPSRAISERARARGTSVDLRQPET